MLLRRPHTVVGFVHCLYECGGGACCARSALVSVVSTSMLPGWMMVGVVVVLLMGKGYLSLWYTQPLPNKTVTLVVG